MGLISSALKKLHSERGSLTVEALISAVFLLLIMFFMCHVLRVLDIYDAMDHCIYNASKQVSVNEPYVLLAQGNGLAEQNARPLIVHGFIHLETKESDLEAYYGSVFQDVMDSLKVKELTGFDDLKCAGTYKITYEVPLLASLPDVELEHQIRIKSIWQALPTDADQEDTCDEDGVALVYTTTNGRKDGIFHTDAECHTLNRSWKTADSVHAVDVSELENYRECQHCVNRRETENDN